MSRWGLTEKNHIMEYIKKAPELTRPYLIKPRAAFGQSLHSCNEDRFGFQHLYWGIYRGIDYLKVGESSGRSGMAPVIGSCHAFAVIHQGNCCKTAKFPLQCRSCPSPRVAGTQAVFGGLAIGLSLCTSVMSDLQNAVWHSTVHF